MLSDQIAILGVWACRGVGVWACRRMGVSAYGRMGVSAYGRGRIDGRGKPVSECLEIEAQIVLVPAEN
jgi:hypothetical protein